MKSRKNLSKLLLVTGFWLIVAINMVGQGCITSITISFNQNGLTPPLQFNDNLTIQVCGHIDPGQNDIDIWNTVTSGGNPSGLVRHWQYSRISSTGPWTVDPYTGTQFYIGSFNSTPGVVYFQLYVTSNGCPTVYSNVATLTVQGSLPSGPTATASPVSSCSPATFTLTASNCGTIRWYDALNGGNLVHTGSPWTNVNLNTTTTYYVSCTTGGTGFNGCESPRTPLTIPVGVVPTLTITGPASVCPGQANVAYSVTNYSGMNYSWTYAGTGGAITGGTTNAITINFTAGATSGNLSVTGTTTCGMSSATPLFISVSTMAPPVIGTITQPTCALSTGSVDLTGLPAGTWTITQTPGGTTTGTGATKTITGLATGTYTFAVAAGTCTSQPSANVVINLAPTPATAPVIGSINNATCSSPGSVVLNNLPSSGMWTLTESPTNNTYTSSGTSFTVTGLVAATYTYTVTNEGGCTSPSSADVVIGGSGVGTPVIGTVTQPSCGTPSSIQFSGLPGGLWTLTQNPGGLVIANGGVTSITVNGIMAGTWTYTVTNSSGCTSLDSNPVTINNTDGPATTPVIGTITQPTCAVPTGSVDFTGLPTSGIWTLTSTPVNVGTSWSGGAYTLSGIPPGTYTFTVTNAGPCTSPATSAITINPVPTIPAPIVGTITEPTCLVTTGSVALSGLPASGTWTITRNPGGTTTTGTGTNTIISMLPTGTYTFSVTDQAGCSSGASGNVIINAGPAVPTAPVVGTITPPTCTLATGSVVLSGLPAGNWTINPGSILGSTPSTTISGLATGTYNFTVTNSVGCVSPASGNVVIIAQPIIPPAPTMVVTQPTCSTLTGTVVLSGWGVGNANIKRWLGASSTPLGTFTSPHTFNAQPLGGPFTYTYQIVGSCQSDATAPVTFVAATPPAIFNVGSTATSYCVGGTGVTITLSGSESGVNYQLKVGGGNDGAALPGTGSALIWNNKTAGVYTIVATNPVSSCTSNMNGSQTITALPLPTATISGSTTICSGSSATISIALTGAQPWSVTYTDGFTPVTVNGIATSPYTFSVSPASARTYSLTAVNDANCTGTFSGSAIISFYPPLVPGAHNTTPLEECLGYNPDPLLFNVTPISGGETPYTYQWRLNGANIAGATLDTYDPPSPAAAGVYTYDCIVTDGCLSTFTTSPKVITIVPEPSVVISGINTICQNASVTLSADITDGTGTYSYEWRSGPTAAGPWTSISGATNQTYNPLTTIGGTYYFQVHIYPAHPECNEATSPTFTLYINLLPAAAGTITGTASVCQGQTGVIYSVPAIANATGYTWTLPTGASITAGANTNSITVSYSAAAISGNITVLGSNACGNGTVSANYAVTVNLLPAAAGTITGTASVCQGQTGVIYSVPAIANATGYTWTLPTGASITAGANTNSITVSYSAAAISGNITVLGSNACGNGTVSANYAVTVNLLPAAAGTITGTASVCQGQTGVIYSVPAIANATGYTWTLPTGASITAGANTNSITVSYSAAAISGNITVLGSNACGNGTVSANYAVTVNLLPAAAGTITGTASVCQGQTGVIYSVPAIANATGYTWTLPTGASITAGANTNSITVSYSAAAISGNITVLGSNACGNGTVSANYAVTVNLLPAAAGTITGTASVCQGQTGVIYSVPAIANATGYTWTLPTGASITAGANTNSITVSYSAAAISGNITVLGSNACGNGTVSANYAVTVNLLPAAAGTITGTASVCQGQTGVIYSVPAIANATGYTWTLPTGASITAGANTNSITVSYSAAAISGNITVLGSNACGNGTVSANYAVTVNLLPAAAGTITGTASVCQGQTGVIYSVPAIANATGYTWTLPTGASITAGANTNSITVSYSAAAISGNITVLGSNACGNGTVSANYAVTVNLLPAAAGTITGTASVCQGQTGVIYSVPAIANATGYTWTLPTGASITAGANTNSITVSYSAAAISGNITVLGSNACGNGTVSANYAVTVNLLPAAAGTITGTASVCQGQTGVIYSVPAIANATGYTWTLPTGASITAGANTNSITVSYSAAAISGNITVLGSNACGNGTVSANYAVTVNLLPAAAGTITGTASVCQGQTGVIYSVPAIANATGYTWTLPTGASITAGANTNSITVSYSAAAISGNITVLGSNACGNGTVSANYAVTVNLLPAAAGTITGTASVCQGQTGVIYSVPAIANATGYTWTLPTGASITAGANTNSITVSYSAAAISGNITVLGSNACGNGTVSANYAVTVNLLPAAAGTITGTASVCQGQTGVIYSVPAIANATGYTWTLPTGASITAGANTNSITVSYSAAAISGNITVLGSNACGNGTVSANYAVTVNLLPAAAGTITGTASVCQGQTGVIYSVPAIANATGYTWTLPTGASITAGANTNSITVSYSAAAISGNITVLGSNACGNGTVSANYAVTVNLLPAAAGTITGTASVCQGQTGVIYSVPAIANATGYTWTLPTGASITAGANTNSITVSYSAAAISGNITVLGSNACGNGTVSANYAVTVNLLPAAAGTITGTASVCQGQTGVIYSVPAIANATGYTWTLPTGASITAGANTNSITVSYSAAAISGNITVLGSNACGNGTVSANYAVTVNLLPAAAGTITGTASVCQGQTGVIYSVPAIANATGYTWTLPTGASITAGANTNSITVSYSAAAISGNITVLGSNACGNGTVSANYAVTVNLLPAAAGTITGTASVCQGQTGVIYSVPAIANATGYTWTLPTGASITAGANTNSITVSYSAAAISGNITVLGSNACGNGTVSANYAVTVNLLPAAAGTITGTASVCQGQTGVIYSVPAIANATGYTWTLPTGASITAGANTNSITVSYSAAAISGNITVLGSNACGNGTVSANYAVTVNLLPSTPTITAGGPLSFCSGGSVTLSSSAGSLYLWSTGATTQSINVTTSGNYSVQVTNAAGCQSLPSAATIVTENPIPATPTITAGGPLTFCTGGSVSLTSSVGSSYLWSTGATTQSINVTTSGSYTVQVTNAAGCISLPSLSTIVSVNSLPAAPTITASGPVDICAGGSVTLTSSAGTSYLWSTGATTQSINATIAGSYTVQVTNAAGCQSAPSSATVVNVNALPATPTITAGGPLTFCTGGSVTLTSSTGTSYLWSTGATTQSINVAAAGSYTVQVTNAAGCQSVPSAATIVTVNGLPSTPTITAGGPLTFCAGGSVNLTSSAGTSYLWSTGATTQSINVTTAGNYTVQVTNAAGCQSTASLPVTITVNPLPAVPTISAGGPLTFCEGDNVTLTASAGAGYLWSTGAITQIINATSSGNYTVQVTNAAGCQSVPSAATIVTVSTAPASPVQTTDCSLGAGNASVTVTSPIGAGLEYSLDGGVFQTGVTFAGVINGTHSITVRNASGCITTGASFNVSCGCVNGPSLTLTSISGNTCGVTPVTISGNTFSNATLVTITEDGAGTVTPATSAVTPFSFTYTPAAADAGNIVTITLTTNNPLGAPCAAAVSTYTLNVDALPAIPTISASGPLSFCTGGSVTLSSSAGTSYLWSTGATTPSINVTTAGSYTVQVTNASGCQSIASAVSVVSVSALPAAPTITAGGPLAFCAGGSVTLTSSAGTSYLWSTGATTQSINATTAGSYTVQVTNAAGCQSVASAASVVTVNALPAAPTITAGGPLAFCAGGSVTLTSSAGSSYLWSTGATTQSINVTTAGSYTVQVTNAAGCQSVASAASVATVNAAPAAPVQTTDCSLGAGNASVTVTSPTGAGLEYSLDGGVFQSGVLFTGIANGSHNIAVRNAAGCTTTGAGFNVSCGCVNGPAINLTGISSATCGVTPVTVSGNTFNNATSVTITANGAGIITPAATATSPFAFTYTPAAGDAGNTVIITVTSDNPSGPPCAPAIATYTLTVNALPAAPTITAGGPLAFCAGGSVTLTSSAGTSYLWSTGATTQSINATTAGSYTVQVTNAAGCQSVASAASVVTVNALPAAPTITAGGPLAFCAGGSVTLSSSAGSLYLWSTGATTQSINVTTSGNYSVQVTNAAGCQSLPSAATIVTENPIPATPTITAGGPLTFCTGGSVSLTSSVGSSYLWSTGATTQSINVTTSGSYTVQVTNAAGCISLPSLSTIVSVNSLPAAPTITASGPVDICAGGSVTLTSSAGTSYLWSTGATTQSINATIAGSYTVQVTNAAGCQSAPSSATVVNVNALPATPTITAGGPLTFCTGGSVTLTSSTGTSYLWSTGATTQSINVAAAGSYTVQVTNAAGCQSVPSAATIVTVNALPSTPTITAGGPLTFCAGGSVNLTSSAGTSYLWSTGATTQSINVTTAGNYTVQVTNAAGCQSTASLPVTITVNPLPAVPTISAGGPLTFCEGDNVTLTASAGAGYLWSTGAITQIINATSSGNYTVQVTNAAGCQSVPSAATIVTVSTAPASPVQTTDCSLGVGNASVTVTSPIGAGLEYSLDGGVFQTGVTFAGVINGTHSITVRNASGCITTGASFNVSCGCVNGPSLTLTSISGNTCGVTPVTISGNTFSNATLVTITEDGAGTVTPATSAVTPFSFTYTPAAADAGNIVTITLTTNNPLGAPCAAAVSTYTLNVDALPAIPTISASGPLSFCTGGSVTLSSSAGTSYLWSTGATTPSINVTTAGSYTVQVTNASGCQSIASAVSVVSVSALPAAPTITAGGPLAFCAGGSVILTSSAGSSYLWSTGATTQSINATTAGSYTVQVTNAAGCQSVASAASVATVNAAPAAPVQTTDCSLGAGNASVTVTSPTGAGLEYSLDGGVFQSGVLFTGIANGSHNIAVRNAAGCTTTGAGFNVSCGCVNGPAINLTGISGATCGVTPVTVSGNTFNNATSLTITANGAGIITPAATATSPFAFTYTPAAGDAGNTVIITVTSDNPSGPPCAPAIATYTLTVNALPAAPTITAGGPLAFCAGGSVTLTSSAGTSYLWSTGATTQSINATTAGSYTVQVTNAAGCQSVASAASVVTVNALPAAPTITAGGPLAFCAGGSVNLTSSAGSSYLWSTGATTQSINVTTAGSYTVQVTNAAGCQSVASAASVATVNAAPAAPVQTTDCSLGAGNASVTVTSPTGAGLEYSLDGGVFQSGVLFTGIANGSHNIAVRNAAGCTTTGAGFNVSCGCVNGPAINLTGISGATCGVTPVTVSGNTFTNATSVTITANGAGIITPAATATSPFAFTYTPAAGDAGNTVIITVTSDNPSGPPCAPAIATYTLTVNALPAAPTITAGGPLAFCAGGSVTLTSSAGSSYLWSTGATTQSINATTAGSYTVQVTNAAGCQSVASAATVVTVNAAPAAPVQTTDCSLGAGNASVTVTSPTGAGLEYSLDGGVFQSGVLFTGIANGSHNIAVRNAAGCTTTGAGFNVSCGCVNGPAINLISISGATCGVTPVTVSGNTFNNATSVTITANGAGIITPAATATSPFAFTYTPAAGDAGNTVIITVTSDNPSGPPCAPAIATYTLTVNALPAAPTITAGGPLAFCAGGSVTLTSSAGSSYLWSTGATTQSINVTTAGSYTVQVTNAAGCQSVASAATVVTVNAAPAAPVQTTDCSLGAGNASVTVTSPTGAGLEYSLDGGVFQSGVLFTGVANGSHNIAVRNAAGCTTTGAGFNVSCGCVNGPAINLTDISGATCGVTPVTVSGNTFNNATSVTITANGAGIITPAATATSPFAFTYTPAAGDAGNTVIITVTSDNPSGPPCAPAIATYTLTVNALPAAPTITAGGPLAFCAGGSVTLTSSAGSSYLWSTGATTQSINVTTAGSYTVQVTNASGCQSVASAASVVTVNALPATPTITAGGLLTFCEGGSVTLTSSAGTSYLWSTGATTQSINVTTAGSYTVQVTNAAGCQSVASAASVVIVNALPAAPTITAGGPLTFCAGGSVTLSSSAGSSYLWSTGATTQSINVTTAGSYTVQVTNAAGCQSVASAATVVTVNSVPAAPTASVSAQPTCTIATGTITVSVPVPGAGITYTVTGTNPVTTPVTNTTGIFAGLTAGDYDVTTSNTGCSSAATVLTVAAQPETPNVADQSISILTGTAFVVNPAGVPVGTTYTWSAPAYTGGVTGGSAQATPQTNISEILTIPSGTGTAVYNVTPALGACTGTPLTVTVTVTSSCIPVTIGTQPADNVMCSGSGPASFTVVASGTSPFIYQWEYNNSGTWEAVANGTPTGAVYTNSGAATLDIAGISSAGTYQYRSSVTNCSGTGNAASNAATLTVNGSPSLPVATLVQPTCSVPTGSITITAPAGAGISYSIDGITFTNTTGVFSLLADGTYSISAMNSTGCVSPVTIVTLNPPNDGPSAPVIGSVAQPTCTDITGEIILTGLPSGNWTVNPGAIAGSGNSTTIPGLTAGTYNYTVTNGAGCISPVSENVIISAFAGSPLTPAVGIITQPSCASATGSVILNGLPSGVWAINPGAITGTGTGATIEGLGAGTYNFTVTNEGGCISPATADIVITAYAGSPVAPLVGAITQPTCQAGTGSVILNGLPSGSWTINPGAITGTGTDAVVSGLNVGTHTFMVTNELGCVSAQSASVIITAYPGAPSTPLIGTIVQPICTVATGSITLNGLPSGNWTIEPGMMSGSGSGITLTDLPTGPYNFSVINEAGCTSAPTATVVFTPYPGAPETPIVEVTQPTCGVSSGSVLLTGLPSGGWTINPGNISGSGTSTSITGLSIGSHNFTVTNASGCISAATPVILILEYPGAPANPPSVLSDYNGFNISCTGNSDGFIKINPTGDISQYSYSWSGPDGFSSAEKDISGLKAGQYVLMITDANNCTASTNYVLTEPQQFRMTIALSVSTDGTFNINCAGANTGTASVTAVNSTGTVNYLWSDGFSGNYRSDIASGTYGIIITDANNCHADSTITLTAPDSLKLSFDVTQPFCPDNSDGSIILTVTGGVTVSDYIYKWSDNSTGRSLQNIPQGFYSVTVQDLNGCIAKDSVQVDPANETCLIIPNAISPNGDLINDVWNITHIEQYPQAIVKIFNNWGVIVWRSEPGYPHPWDGRSNGIALPIDSYFYIIDLHNGSKPIAGNVTIIK